MAKKVASFRLDEGLLERVAAYAKSRGTSQAVVIEAAVQDFMEDAKRGVPDLPVPDTPEVRAVRAAAAEGVAQKLERVAPAAGRQQAVNAMIEAARKHRRIGR